MLGESLTDGVFEISNAGLGWQIDPARLSDGGLDNETLAALNSLASGRADLLAVPLQELAHQLGSKDLDALTHREDLIGATLPPNQRQPDREHIDGLFVNADSLGDLLDFPPGDAVAPDAP